MSHKVRTIQQAITVVGFDSVRAMITAVGIIDAFVGAAAPGLDLRLFWQHAIATGLCAKHLARAASLNPDDAFISGLLHDIGTLVLATRFPEQLAAASAYRIARGCSMLDAERAAIGTDHAAIGRLLAEHWKFPLLIRDAIGDHHAPLPTEIAGPCVVHLADAAVHALGLAQDDDERVPPLCAHAWQGFSLSAGVIHQVLCNTESEFEEACQILAV